MKKILLFLFVVSAHCTLVIDNCISQPVTWMRYYDYQNNKDYGLDVRQTNDGNYVILSDTENPTNTKILLIKVNFMGIPIWTKTIIDSLNYVLHPWAFVQSYDSGFVVTGDYWGGDMFLIKVDKDGNVIWNRYIHVNGASTRGFSINLTNDKGFLVVGDAYFNPDFKTFVIKTDSTGKVIWQNIFGNEVGNYGIQSIDSMYYVTTYSSLIKISKSGDIIWSKNIIQNKYDGISLSFRNNKKSIAGSPQLIQSTVNELYIGYGNTDIRLKKIDSSGNIIWQKIYIPDNYSAFTSFCISPYNNILLTGTTYPPSSSVSYLALIKIKLNGDTIFTKTISADSISDQSSGSVIYTNDNGTLLVGTTNYAVIGNSYNIIAAKTDSLGNTSPIISINNQVCNIPNIELYQNFPNPFNPSTIIKFQIKDSRVVTLKVYDILGKEVAVLVNELLQPGTYETQFSINSISNNQIASGVYFYRITARDFSDVKRMIILK